jgi:hypothetical protein
MIKEYVDGNDPECKNNSECLNNDSHNNKSGSTIGKNFKLNAIKIGLIVMICVVVVIVVVVNISLQLIR